MNEEDLGGVKKHRIEMTETKVHKPQLWTPPCFGKHAATFCHSRTVS